MVAAAGPFGLGPLELGLIIVAILLIFGASRVTDLMGGLGKGVKEFKKGVKDDEEEDVLVEQRSAPIMTTPSSAIPAASQSMNTSVPSGEGTVTVSAVKCRNCETLNPTGAKHCSNCGTALTAPVS